MVLKRQSNNNFNNQLYKKVEVINLTFFLCYFFSSYTESDDSFLKENWCNLLVCYQIKICFDLTYTFKVILDNAYFLYREAEADNIIFIEK